MKGTTYDLPLTDEGHGDAQRAADYLGQLNIGSVKHSKMLRAEQTAKHVSGATGIDSRPAGFLDPLDVGYLAGQRRADAQRRIEYYIRNPHKQIPDGESYGEWHNRFADGLTSELKAAEREPAKARVLVTHSCNAMASKSVVEGEEPEFYGEHSEEPGGVKKLQKTGGRWRVSDVRLD